MHCHILPTDRNQPTRFKILRRSKDGILTQIHFIILDRRTVFFTTLGMTMSYLKLITCRQSLCALQPPFQHLAYRTERKTTKNETLGTYLAWGRTSGRISSWIPTDVCCFKDVPHWVRTKFPGRSHIWWGKTVILSCCDLTSDCYCCEKPNKISQFWCPISEIVSYCCLSSSTHGLEPSIAWNPAWLEWSGQWVCGPSLQSRPS